MAVFLLLSKIDAWTAPMKSAVFLQHTNMWVELLAIFQVLPFSELCSGKVRLKPDFITYCIEEEILKLHHIFKTESWLNKIAWVIQS